MTSLQSRGKIALLACNAGIPLRDKILEELKTTYAANSSVENIGATRTLEQRFADTEIKIDIDESVRGQDVYIVQDVANRESDGSVNDKLRALILLIQAARKSDAHYITAIIPTFPYARQDKQIGREPIGARAVADELTMAGVNRVVTLDIHARQISGFFGPAVTLWNVHAARDIVDYIQREISGDNLVVVSPDAGGAARAAKYAELLQKLLAGIIYKQRDYSIPNSKPVMRFAGDVTGRDVLLVDDMIDTAGTAIEAMRHLKEQGAQKIYFACALPLFNGDAVQKLARAHLACVLEKVIGTDGIYHSNAFKETHSWYAEVSVAHKFAKVIFNINHDQSISALLE